MQTEDMILVSVDDHVVEPPSLSDFFTDHVPAKYKDRVPDGHPPGRRHRRVADRGPRDRELRSQRGAGPCRRRTGARTPRSFDQVRPGTLRRARARPRHERQRRARLDQLPVVARARRSVLRSRATTTSFVGGDDPRLQRLAHRRVVRARSPGRFIPLAPLRLHARCRLDGRARSAASPRRAATRSRSTPSRTASACPTTTATSGTRRGRRVEDTDTVMVFHFGGDAELHAPLAVRRDHPHHAVPDRRSSLRAAVVADAAQVPHREVRARRGRHRLDPVLARERRLRRTSATTRGPAPGLRRQAAEPGVQASTC